MTEYSASEYIKIGNLHPLTPSQKAAGSLNGKVPVRIDAHTVLYLRPDDPNLERKIKAYREHQNPELKVKK